MWIEDRSKWNELISLLKERADGNKIIVTTRSKLVGGIVASIRPYYLKELGHHECLSLFKRWAFKEGEEMQHEDLMQIGEEIVERCKGVPLAVRTLGSLLFLKTDERDWLNVRDNDIWKLGQKDGDILPALGLSYNNLPSYLRSCFAYCSIFPKGHEIYSFDLIYQWIAQGLIRPSSQGQELERIGEQYIQELQSRSFFQDVEDCVWFVKFKMHDLMHDLAQSVAQSEYLTIDIQAKDVSDKIRHLSFADIGLEFPSSLFEPEKLRTIYFQFGDIIPSRSFVGTCLSKFRFLWMLDLRNSTFEVLPSSIGNLKHLKWLNLSFNKCMRSLPNSLCILLSLQTLHLHGCISLEKVPKDFGDLMSLRWLYLTTQDECFSGKVISKLTFLRTLGINRCKNAHHMYSNDGIGFQYLTAIRTLEISYCINMVSLPRDMRHLSALENLIIGNCEKLELLMDDDDDRKEQDAAKKGGGLSSLRIVTLRNLPKLVSLPRWLLYGAAATLKRLELEGCENLVTIQPLEEFRSLRVLYIWRCPHLTSFPDRVSCLHTLNYLSIRECPELIRRGVEQDWDKIAHIPKICLDGIRISH